MKLIAMCASWNARVRAAEMCTWQRRARFISLVLRLRQKNTTHTHTPHEPIMWRTFHYLAHFEPAAFVLRSRLVQKIMRHIGQKRTTTTTNVTTNWKKFTLNLYFLSQSFLKDSPACIKREAIKSNSVVWLGQLWFGLFTFRCVNGVVFCRDIITSVLHRLQFSRLLSLKQSSWSTQQTIRC